MLPTLLLLLLGLVLLLGGGYALVDGASALAARLGVPSLVIGLTVVAFGTSAPELSVNLIAAIEGGGGVSFGNVVGSNLANIGLILGAAALVSPLTIQSQVLAREMPMMLLGTAAFTVMSLDTLLRGTPGVLDRTDGILLLLFFSVFLYTTWLAVVRRAQPDPLIQESIGRVPEGARPGLGRSVAFVVLGLGGLIAGGELTVLNAVRLGEGIGLSPAIIGLTIVALGTSLPELVTSVIAASRGETDLAVGNVVGSNIFNLLLVMGVTVSVRGVPVPEGGVQDLIALIVLSLVLLPVSVSYRGRIVRAEGGLLLALWIVYSVWRVAAAL